MTFIFVVPLQRHRRQERPVRPRHYRHDGHPEGHQEERPLCKARGYHFFICRHCKSLQGPESRVYLLRERLEPDHGGGGDAQPLQWIPRE